MIGFWIRKWEFTVALICDLFGPIDEGLERQVFWFSDSPRAQIELCLLTDTRGMPWVDDRSDTVSAARRVCVADAATLFSANLDGKALVLFVAGHGRWLSLNHSLLLFGREGAGQEASPSAGVIDSQAVKAAESGGVRGYDAPIPHGSHHHRRNLRILDRLMNSEPNATFVAINFNLVKLP